MLFFAQPPSTKQIVTTFPQVITPFGELKLAITINGDEVSSQSHDYYHFPKVGKLHCFEVKGAYFELLISEFNHLPSKWQANESLTCTLRFSAYKNNLDVHYSASWLNTLHSEGDVEPGEHLTAITWKNNKATLSLGAGDEEYYFDYLVKHFPLRWKNKVPYHLRRVKEMAGFIRPIEGYGLVFTPPKLRKGEAMQLSFGIVWKEYVNEGKAEGDISTWILVDDAHRFKDEEFLPFVP